ncbi:uncharacterized protein LOC125489050 [Plutella xylostella]|uniref:uncharacterized protein LOC125489050 n=1 Tax=Plutella xylostella TaxID=51655 RepID=UPI0020325B54|nr:uncharacterized protein LOC125489050 [Plutella xylostella]
MGSRTKFKVDTDKETRPDITSVTVVPSEKSLVSQTGSNFTGLPKLRVLRHPVGPTALQTYPDPLPGPTAEPKIKNDHSSRGFTGIGMVGACGSQSDANSQPSDNRLFSHGCSQLRLGSHIEQHNNGGSLGSPPNILALESERTACDLQSTNTTKKPFKKSIVVDTIGQPNSIILFKKPGGYQVSGPSTRGPRHSTLGKCLQHSSRSTIPPRIPERFGGPSVKKPPTTRMAPTPLCGTACVSCIRSSTNRPICLQECTCCKQVLHDGLPRSTGGILQCIHPGVELPPGLDIPTTLSGSQDPYPPQQVSRSVHTNNSQMGKDLLDAGFEVPSTSRSNPNRETQGNPSRHSHDEASPEDRQYNFGGLVGTGWEDLLKGWSAKELAS